MIVPVFTSETSPTGSVVASNIDGWEYCENFKKAFTRRVEKTIFFLHNRSLEDIHKTNELAKRLLDNSRQTPQGEEK